MESSFMIFGTLIGGIISIIPIILGLIFILVFLSIPVIIFILLIRKSKKVEDEYSAIYDKVALNPSDAAADELIAFHTKKICINDPMSWNKLRAVWLAVNRSSNVTTEKKTQLRDFLMRKGLTMHYKEAEIIDNYMA